jgi:hypothetical protein
MIVKESAVLPGKPVEALTARRRVQITEVGTYQYNISVKLSVYWTDILYLSVFYYRKTCGLISN